MKFSLGDRVSPGIVRLTYTRGLDPVTCPCNYLPEEFTPKDWSQGQSTEQAAGTCLNS